MFSLEKQALKQQPPGLSSSLAVPRVHFKQCFSQASTLARQKRQDSIREVQLTRPNSTWTMQSAKEALGEVPQAPLGRQPDQAILTETIWASSCQTFNIGSLDRPLTSGHREFGHPFSRAQAFTKYTKDLLI